MAGLLEWLKEATPLVGSTSGLLGALRGQSSPSFDLLPDKPYQPGPYQPGQAYGTGQEGLLEQGLMQNFSPSAFMNYYKSLPQEGRGSKAFVGFKEERGLHKSTLSDDDKKAARHEWQYINRNPLAALGWDYRRFSTHRGSSGGPAFNIGGMVNVDPENKTDYMEGYATLSNGIPHHEAVHAGLERLRAAGKLPESTKQAMRSFGEENFTKWLTMRVTGDTEMNGVLESWKNNKLLEKGARDAMKVAADMIAKSRPGGPR